MRNISYKLFGMGWDELALGILLQVVLIGLTILANCIDWVGPTGGIWD